MMKKSENSTALSRRSFLTGAAVLGAGAAMAGLAGCSSGGDAAKPASDDAAAKEPTTEAAGDGSASSGLQPWEVPPEPISDDQIVETIDCDIAVCGAGIAGLPGVQHSAPVYVRLQRQMPNGQRHNLRSG